MLPTCKLVLLTIIRVAASSSGNETLISLSYIWASTISQFTNYLQLINKTESIKDIGCRSTLNGLQYNGTASYAENGRVYQVWTFQNVFTSAEFPDANIEDAKNFCRNPDADLHGPWCWYIIDSCFL